MVLSKAVIDCKWCDGGIYGVLGVMCEIRFTGKWEFEKGKLCNRKLGNLWNRMGPHGSATTVAATQWVIKLTSGYKANEWEYG